jgi:hypothetical protein
MGACTGSDGPGGQTRKARLDRLGEQPGSFSVPHLWHSIQFSALLLSAVCQRGVNLSIAKVLAILRQGGHADVRSGTEGSVRGSRPFSAKAEIRGLANGTPARSRFKSSIAL